MTGKYFEGRLADEHASVRVVVGFDDSQQQMLAAKMESKQPIQVETAPFWKLRGDQMEIVIMEIQISPLHPYVLTSASLKMSKLQVAEKREVKTGLHMQDVAIADLTCIRPILWQNHDQPEFGKSYSSRSNPSSQHSQIRSC